MKLSDVGVIEPSHIHIYPAILSDIYQEIPRQASHQHHRGGALVSVGDMLVVEENCSNKKHNNAQQKRYLDLFLFLKICYPMLISGGKTFFHIE